MVTAKKRKKKEKTNNKINKKFEYIFFNFILFFVLQISTHTHNKHKHKSGFPVISKEKNHLSFNHLSAYRALYCTLKLQTPKYSQLQYGVWGGLTIWQLVIEKVMVKIVIIFEIAISFSKLRYHNVITPAFVALRDSVLIN